MKDENYTTFKGCDIKAVFADKVIGVIQAISVKVRREKLGVYTIETPNPRSFSRGKRGTMTNWTDWQEEEKEEDDVTF